ncbi:hypothetical protein RchiOBHm_Chr2g0169391 [Rosa chinensis]|uniref:Uncharacterized protein n=1 Tax=Rosa chinensis TaxID=74649 RepID=A0A2P6S4V0_ROSCH|nr:hypothetical protein RchiOBHm_Chr2g0169391 [Rosa chinensis]
MMKLQSAIQRSRRRSNDRRSSHSNVLIAVRLIGDPNHRHSLSLLASAFFIFPTTLPSKSSASSYQTPMLVAEINGSFGRFSKVFAFSLLLVTSGSEGKWGFEILGLSLGLKFWVVFRFWGLEFWVFRFWGFEGLGLYRSGNKGF